MKYTNSKNKLFLVGTCCPLWIRVLASIVSIFFYIFVLPVGAEALGTTAGVIFILPVIVFSWCFGWLLGLIVALIGLPINTVMFVAVGITEINPVVRFVIMALAVIISLVTGIASNLLCKLEIKNKKLDQAKKMLEKTLEEVEELQGLLPICMYCKSIRDSSGYWHRLEEYISSNTKAQFSHGICNKCLAEKHSNRLATSGKAITFESIEELEELVEEPEELEELVEEPEES